VIGLLCLDEAHPAFHQLRISPPPRFDVKKLQFVTNHATVVTQGQRGFVQHSEQRCHNASTLFNFVKQQKTQPSAV
jgi:hypothetical protein